MFNLETIFEFNHNLFIFWHSLWQIYSITNGKVNAFIHFSNTSDTINDILIREHFGEFVEEDYISKYNHLMRHDNAGNDDNFIDPMVRDCFNEENGIEVEPPPIRQCKVKLKLNGPYSSLSIDMLGLTEATRTAKVVVDKHSINSVILENDPQVCIHFMMCWESYSIQGILFILFSKILIIFRT